MEQQSLIDRAFLCTDIAMTGDLHTIKRLIEPGDRTPSALVGPTWELEAGDADKIFKWIMSVFNTLKWRTGAAIHCVLSIDFKFNGGKKIQQLVYAAV